MPTINADYYTGFVMWSAATAHWLAKSDPDSVQEFGAEVAAVAASFAAVIRTFPSKGKWYQLGPKIAMWIAGNPDPLDETRDRIEGIYQKWQFRSPVSRTS